VAVRDVQFRRFTASPLLGGAHGASLYVDSVRVNEVFGDTVNWNLKPKVPMTRMSLLPGGESRVRPERLNALNH